MHPSGGKTLYPGSIDKLRHIVYGTMKDLTAPKLANPLSLSLSFSPSVAHHHDIKSLSLSLTISLRVTLYATWFDSILQPNWMLSKLSCGCVGYPMSSKTKLSDGKLNPTTTHCQTWISIPLLYPLSLCVYVCWLHEIQ